MGCACYYNKASNARTKIEKLDEEKKKYEDFSSDIQVAIDALEKYASFLRSLGKQCSEIRVTGDPYDMGLCSTHANSIDNLVNLNLNTLKTSADNAIEDIEEEKKTQQQIIDNEFYCRSCYEKRLAREAARNQLIEVSVR